MSLSRARLRSSQLARYLDRLLSLGNMSDLPFTQFEDAGLHPVMLENVKLCRYKVPTPIQAYCLPSVLKGIDIIGIAQTGMRRI